MRNVIRFCLLALFAAAPLFAQSIHYLDCAGGDDSLDSLTPQNAWKSLERANAVTFQPGDSLLIKRGSVCAGMLAPQGSGADGHPISLGAYGTGSLPRIIGTGLQAGLKLSNQQYWDIAHLDITGGDPYGIFITATVPHLQHFRISDVVVHDVTGQPKTKQTGLVVIGTNEKAPTLFDDIVIDGVTAYNTTQWAGIIVTGGVYAAPGSPRGSSITIRNTIVHDMAGDGILLALAKNGLIEHNVAWNTGMQPTQSIGTPNAIWEWECDDCTVQYNEGFFSDSPGVDGGVFDIDWGCHNNIVQYNFAHDSQGYCASVFGAGGGPGSTTHSILRRNLCLDNGRSPRMAQHQGAIFLSTWDNGHLSDVAIVNNTILWDPPPDAPAIVNQADIDQNAPHIFANNLIISRSPLLVRSTSSLQLNHNEYRVIGDAAPTWQYGSQTYSSLATLRSGAHQEREGTVENPRLNQLLQPTIIKECYDASVGMPDLYDHHEPSSCVFGAFDPVQPESQPRNSFGKLSLNLADGPYKAAGWTLLALLAPENSPDASMSRSQFVVLQGTLRQFAALGLHIDVIPNAPIDSTAATNWAADWNFEKIRRLPDPHPENTHKSLGITAPTGMLLVSPEGTIVRRWNGLIEAPELNLTLRSLLGVPPGMQAQYR